MHLYLNCMQEKPVILSHPPKKPTPNNNRKWSKPTWNGAFYSSSFFFLLNSPWHIFASWVWFGFPHLDIVDLEGSILPIFARGVPGWVPLPPGRPEVSGTVAPAIRPGLRVGPVDVGVTEVGRPAHRHVQDDVKLQREKGGQCKRGHKIIKRVNTWKDPHPTPPTH